MQETYRRWNVSLGWMQSHKAREFLHSALHQLCKCCFLQLCCFSRHCLLVRKNDCGISSVRIPTHTTITVFYIYTPVWLKSATDSCEAAGPLPAPHRRYLCVHFLGEASTHARTFICITSVFQVLIWQILPRAAKLFAASFRN